MRQFDVVIIGGGSAGMAAAVTLHDQGITNILIIEREPELGGILMQCIHNGFGLQEFQEELTGPEYAERFIEQVEERNITCKLETVVTAVHNDKTIEYVNVKEGFVKIQCKAVLFTTGCYERNRGAISIPGSRPNGVYTAGAAQKYLNMDGYLVGKNVFILGSGDIGLIMARRMTLEGANVLGVADIMPYSGGLKRNIVQCLEDYDIPLYLSHTVTEIKGEPNLTSIVLSQVDGFTPIPGTEREIELDTLLLSIGLIPENGLAEGAGVTLDPMTKGPIVNHQYMTNVDGIFATGNALHVHDLVDFVTEESRKAGYQIASYLSEQPSHSQMISLLPKHGIRYVVPQQFSVDSTMESMEFFFRVTEEFKQVVIKVSHQGQTIITRKKRHCAPAEMERIKLQMKDLTGISDNLDIEVITT